jgi:hypothetical protein
MCTVTWLRRVDGYELFFNRDELLTRAPAAPPRVFAADGTRWIAPEDGDFGGTWLAANEHGLAVGLLNRWELAGRGPAARSGDPAEPRSRGWLVRDLAPARGLGALVERLEEQALERYRPFTLLAIAAAQPALVAEWDGERLALATDGDRRMPLVSSGYDLPGVTVRRRATYEALVAGAERLEPELLEAYHREHAGGPSATSVCMRRDDAATQSISRVVVTRERVAFWHDPQPFDGAGFRAPVELERVAAPAGV